MTLTFNTPMLYYQLDLIRWKIFGAFTKESVEVLKQNRFRPKDVERQYTYAKMGYGHLYRLEVELTDVEIDEYLQVC